MKKCLGIIKQHKTKKVSAEDYSAVVARRMAARYDSGIRDTKLHLVRKLLADIKGTNILDIGAGIGNFSNMCYELGANVIAVDYSEAMIARIGKRYGTRFDAFVCEADSMPFGNSQFDTVLLLDVIEHLYKVKETLTEIRRVLKADCRLIITTPKCSFGINTLYRLYLRLTRQFCFEVHLFKPSELISVLVTSGFKLVESEVYQKNSAIYLFQHKGN